MPSLSFQIHLQVFTPNTCLQSISRVLNFRSCSPYLSTFILAAPDYRVRPFDRYFDCLSNGIIPKWHKNEKFSKWHKFCATVALVKIEKKFLVNNLGKLVKLSIQMLIDISFKKNCIIFHQKRKAYDCGY